MDSSTCREDVFSPMDTNICKGIAIIAMVLHHSVGLYYNSFDVHWYLENSEGPVNLLVLLFSTAGKVCVSLFTILSGYGLSKSYGKSNKTVGEDIRFSISHLLRFYSILWFVGLIMLLFSACSASQLSSLYGNPFPGIKSCFMLLADFLGIRNVLVSSSWYVSAIVVFYLIFPLMQHIERRIGFWIIPLSAGYLMFALLQGGIKEDGFLFYLPEFVTGIFLADSELLDRLKANGNKRIQFGSGVSVIAFFVLRLIFALTIDYFFALSIIVFEIAVLSNSRYIGNVLSSFGKHSANMWLSHVRILYLLSMPFRLVFPLTLIISFALSFVIEKCKSISGYNILIKKARVKLEKG